MSLSEAAKKQIDAETEILSGVIDALEKQRSYKQERMSYEERRARELTSELVRTNRAEEKWQLASDEAVSHGLKEKQKSDIDVIERILKAPYFARMLLREELNGQEREIEYKLGLAENSECRIIDWRKAPIARLYYEYKEGDDYSEQIQGRERSGTVELRNQVEIAKGELRRLSCRYGTFVKNGSVWEAIGQGLHAHDRGASADSNSEAQNILPQIAALLSPEQFKLISDNLDQAMLIQGIAGSGKTTVALHRLAWLFADEKRAPKAERTLVLVLSNSLKTYLSKTLPALGVDGVAVVTLVEWFDRQLCALLPHLRAPSEDTELPHIKRPNSPIPSGIERVKRSMALLSAVERAYAQLAKQPSAPTITPDAVLLAALNNSREILAQDETKLLTEEVIRAAYQRTSENFAGRCCDYCDDALLLRIALLQRGSVLLKDGSYGKLEHLFADEVQDYSPADLACILSAVDNLNHLTIVGDTAQKIDPGTTFPGWDKLKRHWNSKDSLAHFVSLDLTYRSTVEILRLADYIQRAPSSINNAGRHGRVPIWFRCLSEERGIKSATDWLLRAVEKYPSAITAVVCRDPFAAKHVLSLLKPAFGPIIRLGDDRNFSFEGGIVVTHASQVRGLEFTNLLVWNPAKNEYPADSNGRNLLYLVLSRTRENLCLVTWGKHTEVLPPLSSNLVRGYDLLREELEELEEQKLKAVDE